MIISVEYEYPGVIRIWPPPTESEGKELAAAISENGTVEDQLNGMQMEINRLEDEIEDLQDTRASLRMDLRDIENHLTAALKSDLDGEGPGLRETVEKILREKF